MMVLTARNKSELAKRGKWTDPVAHECTSISSVLLLEAAVCLRAAEGSIFG